MRNFRRLTFAFLTGLGLLSSSYVATAQEAEAAEESSSPFDAGFDLYTSYIWRGAKFGSGPAFQPWASATFGGLEIGAWGSVNASSDEALEMDLYATYGFDFGLSITVTDYYFGGDWTEFSDMHYIEPSLGYEIGDFSFTAAYMLLPGSAAVQGVDGSPAMLDTATFTIIPAVDAVEAAEATDFAAEADMYFEIGYSFKGLDIAVGAGNGQYVSPDDDFMLCNVTLGTSKDIQISDKFTLPLSGAVTLDPSTGGFYICAGISF